MKSLCMILFLLITSLFAQEELFIAVNDFNSRGIKNDEVLVITDKIRDEFLKRPLFKVMARSEMGVIMKEMEFQQTGACSDEACAIEMGRIFGVEKIVTGTIGRVGQVYSIAIKMIDVETSEILYSVSDEFEGRVEDLLTTHAITMVDNFETEIQKQLKAQVKIVTVPENADIIINGSPVGVTPYTSAFLPAGSYKIEITKESYNNITEEILLKIGMSLERSYTLQHSKIYKDSLFNIDRKVKKKKQWTRRIVFGVVALAAGGAGYYFNGKAEEANDNRTIAKAAYNNAPSTSDFTTLKKDITSAEDDFDSNALYRNLSYGLAGVSSFGLAISIPF